MTLEQKNELIDSIRELIIRLSKGHDAEAAVIPNLVHALVELEEQTWY